MIFQVDIHAKGGVEDAPHSITGGVICVMCVMSVHVFAGEGVPCTKSKHAHTHQEQGKSQDHQFLSTVNQSVIFIWNGLKEEVFLRGDFDSLFVVF